MKFSVVIPVFNGERYIEKCVESLIFQSVKVDEIIIVNDHSTDNTDRICLRINEKYDNVIYLTSDGNGVSAARNKGISVASGDIIGFCDADDMVKEDMSKLVKDYFKVEDNKKILITGFEKVEKKSGKVENYVYDKTNVLTVDSAIKLVVCEDSVGGFSCNKFFRASLLKENNYDTDLTHCEDLDFVIRKIILCDDYQIGIVNKVTYIYYFNDKSASQNINNLLDYDDYEIRYNKAFYKLANNPECGVYKKYFYYKLLVLNLDIISFYSLDKRFEDNIKKVIKNYFQYFIKMFGLKPIYNFKNFIKIIFKIRNGKVFQW